MTAAATLPIASGFGVDQERVVAAIPADIDEAHEASTSSPSRRR
jgi:hypothetical protein